MNAFQSKLPAAAIAVLLSSTAASAQVSAQQVWDAWKGQLAIYGENGVTIGSEVLEGGVLTVTGITLAMADESGEMTGDMGDLVFTEVGDGTVMVTMAPEMTLALSSDDGMGTTTDMSMTIVQTGATTLVSGTPEAMNYAVTATRIGLTIDELTSDGAATEGAMVFGINDVTGTYTTTGISDEAMDIDYNLDAASMDILVNLTDPTDGTIVSITGKSEGLTMNAAGMIPVAILGMAPMADFPPGLTMAGGYGFGTSSYEFSFTENGATTAGSVAMGSGTTSFDLSEAGVGFDLATTDLMVSTSGDDMPFPVNVSLGEYGIGMVIPLAPSDTPSDFGFSMNLIDLSVNDEIWAMFDPGAALPRGPATTRIDVTGTATIMANLMDPAAQQDMAMTGTPPGQLETLNLNDLLVSFGGAELSGSGALTLDNTDMVTFGGIPKPVGTIELALNGANGLLDRLVQAGLIPEDQVMMGRMMLGMFAVPVGDDMLTSTIEFTAEGGILANGQRIQ